MDRKRRALVLCGSLCACARMPSLFKDADTMTAEQHFRLGYAYEARGRDEDAIRQYRNAVRLNRSDPEAWVALGNIEFKLGNFPRAEDDYLRALNVSPLHAGAQNNLAMAYLAQNKNLEEAERLAKMALRQKGPLRPYVLDTLAGIYARERRFAEARAAAAQAAAALAHSTPLTTQDSATKPNNS